MQAQLTESESLRNKADVQHAAQLQALERSAVAREAELAAARQQRGAAVAAEEERVATAVAAHEAARREAERAAEAAELQVRVAGMGLNACTSLAPLPPSVHE